MYHALLRHLSRTCFPLALEDKVISFQAFPMILREVLKCLALCVYFVDVAHVSPQNAGNGDGSVFLLVVLKDGDDCSARCDGCRVQRVGEAFGWCAFFLPVAD